jgi:Terminase large subunit, T4likevirus-type, N-terminal
MPTLATIQREVERIRARIEARKQQTDGPLARLRADPARILADAGMAPDDWQAELLRADWKRAMLLISRQAGKSQVGAALALQTAFFRSGSLTLILSPTQRQSGELFKDKLMGLYDRLNRPIPAANETALTLTLVNGSRIVSLPGEEGTVRCYSGVGLLVIDEAAKVPDALYLTVRPMLATSRGRIIAMSTPFGRRGWFYDTWNNEEQWHRVKVAAEQCPRIPADFLADERQALGDRWYAQEYSCAFMDMAGALFSTDEIDALVGHPVAAVPFLGDSDS